MGTARHDTIAGAAHDTIAGAAHDTIAGAAHDIIAGDAHDIIAGAAQGTSTVDHLMGGDSQAVLSSWSPPSLYQCRHPQAPGAQEVC